MRHAARWRWLEAVHRAVGGGDKHAGGTAVHAGDAGVAAVVGVYILVQSLAVGLEKSSRNTGDPRNVMIVRQGSTAESSSQVTREQFRVLFLDVKNQLIADEVMNHGTIDHAQGQRDALSRHV